MKLVIAEKPSVARTIAKIIGANKKQDGYLYGNGYVVSWCVGHLVGLANPDEYDEKYSKWKYEDLPIIPDEWTFVLNPGTEKQYRILERLMTSDKTDSIVVATDAGREGELIFRLVYNMVGSNKPFERLWISSMEDSAIKEGFDNLKKGTDYDRLYESAIARAKADWLVGMNGTRLFTTLYYSKLTIGRVQTPTLAMIAERDYKINNFAQDKFYHIELDLGEFKVKSERLEKEADAKSLMEFCQGKKAIISQAKKENKKNKPPLLFDLTTLQREANRMFSYTAKQTLDYTQNLYEKKLVTYPRTDSRYITDDMQETVKELVHIIDADAKANIKRITNNKKVTDHHAIIPTKYSLSTNLSALTKQERAVYELIKTKLMAATSTDYKYEQVTIVAKVEDKKFKASGKTELDLGFKKIENDFKARLGMKKDSKAKTESTLPKISKNDEYEIVAMNQTEGITSPPKHFTEDTLLSAMEKAGSEELDKSLDTEKKGLGTPATRAGIIEKLLKVGYIERQKKNLLVTEKGESLVKVVPDNLKSAKKTSEWENILTEISTGDKDSAEFMGDIEKEVVELVKEYPSKKVSIAFRSPNDKREVVGKCPRCTSPIYESEKNYYCGNRDCNFSIWKNDRFFESKKKELTKPMVKALLEKGRIKCANLYSEKKDKYYEAYVYLVDTGKYVNYKLVFFKSKTADEGNIKEKKGVKTKKNINSNENNIEDEKIEINNDDSNKEAENQGQK